MGGGEEPRDERSRGYGGGNWSVKEEKDKRRVPRACRSIQWTPKRAEKVDVEDQRQKLNVILRPGRGKF